MINVSPVGPNVSVQERNDFEAYDKQHQVRSNMVEALKTKSSDHGLTYVCSFRPYPTRPTAQQHHLLAYLACPLPSRYFAAIRSVGKYPLTSFPLVGMKPTACNMLRPRRRSQEQITPQSILSVTKRTTAEMIGRFSNIRGLLGILSPVRGTR